MSAIGRSLLAGDGSESRASALLQIRGRILASLMLVLLCAGCGNMKKQRYLRPLSPAPQFANGSSAQLPPPHAVPRTVLTGTVATGVDASGQLAAQLPMPVTRELLERGRQRFAIYCAVCHGEDGYGRGIIVRRGFPSPPSFHDERLRMAPVGYFFQVITMGHGWMYSYADRVAPKDRWAIAAYIRTLQLSQRVLVQDLPSEDRRRLEHP